MMRIKDGRVDFAASDMPLPSSELDKLGLVQFPLVIGGAVVVVNIDNVRPGQIRLTGPLLADIYLGKIADGPIQLLPRSTPISSCLRRTSFWFIVPTDQARPTILPTTCRR